MNIAKQYLETVTESFSTEKSATAKQEAEEATEKLAKAKEALENDSIFAPFNAYINKVSIKVGDIVESGTTVCEVLDLSKIWLRGLIDKDAVESFKPGSAVNVEFSGIANEIFPGKIISITTEPVEQRDEKALFELRIELDKLDGRVLPGMEATATIIN
ncbi:MAG: HlyD family secretion protein [Synergistaceae bacterium]|nr:HlyD family secretion protein [Synergistaceae bacterium]